MHYSQLFLSILKLRSNQTTMWNQQQLTEQKKKTFFIRAKQVLKKVAYACVHNRLVIINCVLQTQYIYCGPISIFLHKFFGKKQPFNSNNMQGLLIFWFQAEPKNVLLVHGEAGKMDFLKQKIEKEFGKLNG